MCACAKDQVALSELVLVCMYSKLCSNGSEWLALLSPIFPGKHVAHSSITVDISSCRH